MSRRTLQDVIEDRNNSFNAVRLLAAAAVFVSHAFLIVPAGTHHQPLDNMAFDLGQLAVNVFFFLSGLMLSRSFALKPHLGSFIIARILRIFPGLLVCGALIAWVIAPFSTSLSLGEYFTNPATWIYPLLMPVFFSQTDLPGAFLFGMEPGQVNIPLWTIKYELIAYLAFLGIPLLKVFGSRAAMAALVFLFGTLVVIGYQTHAFDASFAGSLIRFGFCFALGMLAFTCRDRIVLSWPIALCGIVLAFWLSPTPLGQVASIIAFAYAAATLGATSIPGLTRATRHTDLSYGIYLYSFPIQQALLARFGTTLPLAILMSLAAAAVTVCFAYLSWHWVERPALSLKRYFTPAQQAGQQPA
ncbi:acyltransferase family protein [Devosia submarina]|uniref:acyltransferase family protein n=1 Tax=Devosia submarina TaxID=1173082 RepID=UPI000D3DA373|nr:acyltransferase [Devosia submarina]